MTTLREMPGKVYIRSDDDSWEWRDLMPENQLTYSEKWFLGSLSMLSLTLLTAAVVLLLVFD